MAATDTLNASKLTGINSLNGVIKYLILNSIYKKGFLSPNELKIIDELKSEINKRVKSGAGDGCQTERKQHNTDDG